MPVRPPRGATARQVTMLRRLYTMHIEQQEAISRSRPHRRRRRKRWSRRRPPAEARRATCRICFSETYAPDGRERKMRSRGRTSLVAPCKCDGHMQVGARRVFEKVAAADRPRQRRGAAGDPAGPGAGNARGGRRGAGDDVQRLQRAVRARAAAREGHVGGFESRVLARGAGPRPLLGEGRLPEERDGWCWS